MAKIIKSWESDSGACRAYQRSTLELAVSEDEALSPAEILAQARAEAEQRVREAYAEGHRRGIEAGKAQFESEVGAAAQALQAAAEALVQARQSFLDALEPQVARLATIIAERVLQRECRIDPDIVMTMARAALQRLAECEQIVLRLHPADLDALRRQRVTLLEEFEGVESLELTADESVAPGGCIAETESVRVDARLEAQFNKIVADLLE